MITVNNVYPACFYFMLTCSFQKSRLSLYLDTSNGTPEPPYSVPNAFLIMVIGCIGNS